MTYDVIYSLFKETTIKHVYSTEYTAEAAIKSAKTLAQKNLCYSCSHNL